ncbi:AmmeMemoRadiSam system protein B [Methanococcus voltae]|uniref:MEMO1 family protein J3E07_000389 n=1 Tax=Methanococcus voltae TaxID=2188 RepID=A0A8J7RLG1_METVO|nr:AmmeMemoRadiSam system protein B [Methanococcus voltae]MBP2172053.1 AmmeMemoRadiSam system protein B [Methanococcus voltae]MBP2200991.1 AmmeMemoRadiSam system protein B [Methanococcus voltae]
MSRTPIVKDIFYPGDVNELISIIEYFYTNPLGIGELPLKINSEPNLKSSIGLICPHAGYEYSGITAGYSYYELSKRLGDETTIVILSPNHTGMGARVAISNETWETPLGDITPDLDFISELIIHGLFELDDIAHLQEHSIEVQLPFLKHLELLGISQFKIVPICCQGMEYEEYIEMGDYIHNVAKKLNKNIVVIASTDFSHYEPQETTIKKDAKVIKNVLELDEKALYDTVMDNNISMCGFGQVITMLHILKLSGAKNADLLNYMTSGDISKDYTSVVGYCALLIE